MYLYYYGSYTGGRALSETLVQRSYLAYRAECGGRDNDRERPEQAPWIKRTEKGKPYFEEGPYFSVSHTGSLWVCLMGEQPVGVDVQKIGRRTYAERIAARYYTPDEQNAVADGGIETFFQIWARKEAYAKFTGKGIQKDWNMFSTLQCTELLVMDLKLRPDVKAACCMRKKEAIWNRKLG